MSSFWDIFDLCHRPLGCPARSVFVVAGRYKKVPILTIFAKKRSRFGTLRASEAQTAGLIENGSNKSFYFVQFPFLRVGILILASL